MPKSTFRPVAKLKKVKKAKPKKASLTDYINLCDELWRLCIHVRDKSTDQYKLLTTGIKTPGTEAHHIYTREAKSTRWSTQNGILLGSMHNQSDAHKRQERFKRNLVTLGWFTMDEFDELYIASETLVRYRQPDYEIIKMNLICQLNIYLNRDPGYKSFIRERMESNIWRKRWPITMEEKMMILK